MESETTTPAVKQQSFDKPWQFQPGQSGNPSGRQRGSRNKATMAVQALLDGEAEAITRKAIEQALAGDMSAIKLVMERLVPPRKDAPVDFDVPPLGSAADAPAIMSSVMQAVATGQITPSEAKKISEVLATYMQAYQTIELEVRMQRLEGFVA